MSKSRTHFSCGHPRSPENTFRYVASTNGKDYTRCDLCRRGEAVRRHEAERVKQETLLRKQMEQERFVYPREFYMLTAIARSWQARSELRA
jgi:hypothetical protein